MSYDDFSPAVGVGFNTYPNIASFHSYSNQVSEMTHDGGSAGSIITGDSYNGSQSIYVKAGDSLYINTFPLGLGEGGSAGTTQLAFKFKSDIPVGTISALAGEWTDTKKTILWGIEKVDSTNHRFVLMWSKPYDDGIGVSFTETSIYSANFIIDVKKWHLYRLAVNFSALQCHFFIDDELQALVGIPADSPNPAASSYSGYEMYFASTGASGLDWIPPSYGTVPVTDVWVETVNSPDIEAQTDVAAFAMDGQNIVIWTGLTSLKFSDDGGATWADGTIPDSTVVAPPYHDVPTGWDFHEGTWYAQIQPSDGDIPNASNTRIASWNFGGSIWDEGPLLQNRLYTHNGLVIDNDTGRTIFGGRGPSLLTFSKYDDIYGSGSLPTDSYEKPGSSYSVRGVTQHTDYVVYWTDGGAYHVNWDLSGTPSVIPSTGLSRIPNAWHRSTNYGVSVKQDNTLNKIAVYDARVAGPYTYITIPGITKGVVVAGYDSVNKVWAIVDLGTNTGSGDANVHYSTDLDASTWTTVGVLDLPTGITNALYADTKVRLLSAGNNWWYLYYIAGNGGGTNSQKWRLVKFQLGSTPSENITNSEGWLDVPRVYQQIAILDTAPTACGNTGVPAVPFGWSPPITSPTKKFLSVDIWDPNDLPDTGWANWSPYKTVEEKGSSGGTLKLEVPFHESAGSNSFAANGAATSIYYNSLTTLNSLRIFGAPSVGEDPLIVNGVHSTTITADAGQAYLLGSNNVYDGGIHAFIIKHTGVAKVRTLVFVGDMFLPLAAGNQGYTIELTADHKVRVGVPGAGIWNYFTSTTTVPIDQLSTILVYPVVAEGATAVSIVINDYPLESGVIFYQIGKWDGFETSDFLSIGGKLNSGVDYTTSTGNADYELAYMWSLASISESAEGVTFENFSVVDTGVYDPYYYSGDLEGLAWDYFEKAISSEYLGGYIPATLLADIRFQGRVTTSTSGTPNVTDLVGKYHWESENAKYSRERAMEGNISSLRLQSGIPGVNAGRVNCLDTSTLLSDIAAGPYCVEAWALTRERGITTDFGTGLTTDSLTNYRRPFFGLIDTFSNSSYDPFWEIAANGRSGSASRQYQPYMHISDEIGNPLSHADDPNQSPFFPLSRKIVNDTWTHIAFTREISGSDSIYRLFAGGLLVYTFTLVGEIIDYSNLGNPSLVNPIFRFGSILESRPTADDNTAWVYLSGAKIWKEARYTTGFTPVRFDNAAVDYTGSCPLIPNHTAPLKVGDTFRDTATDITYIYDGTTWNEVNIEAPTTTSSVRFAVTKTTSQAVTATWKPVISFDSPTSIGDPYVWPSVWVNANYPGTIGLSEGEYLISVTATASASIDLSLSGDDFLGLSLGGPAFDPIPNGQASGTSISLNNVYWTAGRGALLGIEVQGSGNLTALTWTITKL